ncbi:unnamed protein product [Phytophthora lilii]|uniref:Unnamed protein product n=1 Tax=Phytophthora lilii TaxID=2077276 RepID=A0A9W6YKE5_9STRA|nr:unnamed protein product [Phytophthora lilii]
MIRRDDVDTTSDTKLITQNHQRISMLRSFFGNNIQEMGCVPSKDLKTNLTADEPAQVIGSTIMHADQIVALGDSAFVPIRDAKTGEGAIMEIHVGEKKISIYRGMANRAVRSGIA